MKTLSLLSLSLCAFSMEIGLAQSSSSLPPKSVLPGSGLELERRTQAGSFFDVVGRRSAAFGYEHRGMEVWVYPMKIADDFRLAFKIEGYPQEFEGAEVLTHINVRPEATTFTYSHAAFTVRETIFAPIDEPGLIILLDVESVLPIQIIGAFKPKLGLMWPAGLMTGNVDFNKDEKIYYLVEESNRFVGAIGSPGLTDISVMPYQEEPRDHPLRYVIDLPRETFKSKLIPIVIAGSIEGREKARETYRKLLGGAQQHYQLTVDHYRRLNEETLSITTPDDRLNKAFAWAKVGIDKGLATNPYLGTGLIAGFRTSGNSERPGFAWYFGRDALWTSLAINSYGDFAATKSALEFLKRVQRADGKIPHEISQSASLIPWFTDYPYPWASADSTPLYIVAHADYLRASGDRELIKQHWDSIVKAYRFALSTDTDGNGLIENTKVGHGWVEGGRLSPPHEEIYLQGLWIEALKSLAEMANAIGVDSKLAEEAQRQAERSRQAVEQTYWVEAKKIYAFATNQPRAEMSDDERNEKDTARKARMKELREGKLIDETTALPAVPMWWRLLDEKRADRMLDRIGAAEMSADWGARIISNQSLIYDPLSYHYGSVWPLFTGWAAMAAYRYHRAQIGYDYLTANALLTYDNALGYVTELISGDFNQAFGRSSHHQVWSCAMVVTPMVRGMLGLEADALRNRISFAPQLPADWNEVIIRGFQMGDERFGFRLQKIAPSPGWLTARPPPKTHTLSLSIDRRRVLNAEDAELVFAPSFPPDAEIIKVSVGKKTRKCDLIRTERELICQVKVSLSRSRPASGEPGISIEYLPGTEIVVEREAARVADSSRLLKVLSTEIDADTLRVIVEGRGGQTYRLMARSSRQLLRAQNAELDDVTGAINPDRVRKYLLRFTLPQAEGGGYVRQTIRLDLGSHR